MASPQSTGPRLLVVDDNDDNRDMLARRLQRRGYEVDTARSGADALDAIDRAGNPDNEQARYALVLLDVMMPGVNGLEVLQYIRQRYSKSQLPVLMATARSDSDDVVEALRLGANDYMIKPLNFTEVIAALDVALNQDDDDDQEAPQQQDESGSFTAD
ncbi:Copper-sensing two-component system response regulator CpxR [Enhygromyxa salina]|uniref:Copper-sensing two-component system response regulator CpxR n=1 Tax=Enhygromyxa salina TaxID=215803 RepID=A0A0C2D3L0_9BACT|nr:response regulator [Enhygromyxa salina]KIG17806.1 Copper-sensing two-component system response regulator CpxR [Enhygromyxa salina]